MTQKGRQTGRFPRLYEPDRPASGFPNSTRRRDDAEDAGSASGDIDERILIDAGRYVARSYRREGYLAMWLVAVGIVQFYDEQGQMLATINLFETLRPKIAAA